MTNVASSTTAALAAERDAGEDTGQEVHATARALMRGTASSADRAAHIAYALRQAGLTGEVTPVLPTAPDGSPAPLPKVTPQQLRVIECRVAGLSYTETAAHLYLSVETVKRHVGNLHRRWGVNTSVELALVLVRCGVIPSPVPADGVAEVVRVTARQWEVRCDGEVLSTHRTRTAALAEMGA